MPLIRPFPALRPAAGRAEEVAAPPYDVLNSAEARERVKGRPLSFLHISKPEIDLPEGTDPHDASVYAKGKESFEQMLREGVLVQDQQPGYYLYRLIMGSHQQIGLVAAASVPAYDTHRIRRHEFTRPDKERDRVRQIDTLNCQTGPVFLTYRHNETINKIVAAITSGEPEVAITADDGIEHALWTVTDQPTIETITHTFDAMDAIYIADGHHRSAAASRVCASRKAANPNHTGDEAYNYFLTVIFPDDQMMILDYNRVITDLNGLDPASFLERVAERFEVTRSASAARPQGSAEFGMYLNGDWYRLKIRPDLIPADDPVAQLDVSLLADNLIEPVLGIGDPRRDRRIDFVGGIRGLEALERRVDSGEMAVAFALYPTSMDQLMRVADANAVMPPKSTWFEPKLADGLASQMLD